VPQHVSALGWSGLKQLDGRVVLKRQRIEGLPRARKTIRYAPPGARSKV